MAYRDVVLKWNDVYKMPIKLPDINKTENINNICLLGKIDKLKMIDFSVYTGEKIDELILLMCNKKDAIEHNIANDKNAPYNNSQILGINECILYLKKLCI